MPPLVPVASRGTAATTQAATATVEFLDVGQGDAVLIRSPEGKVALVDAGPSKEVVKTLRDRGVTTIDLVVVSHHHTDHYGGMDDVIREFRPAVFLASASKYTSPTYLRLLQLVEREDLAVIAPEDRQRKIELGSVVITVLPQPPEDEEEENNNSVGLRGGLGPTVGRHPRRRGRGTGSGHDGPLATPPGRALAAEDQAAGLRK